VFFLIEEGHDRPLDQPTEGPFSCYIVELAASGQRRKVSRDEFLR